jgi:hypothetical protein
VSFGAGIFAGTRIIAALDSRDPAKGEQPQQDFDLFSLLLFGLDYHEKTAQWNEQAVRRE